MNQQFPVRAIAGCFALAAFSVAIISGLGAGRSTNAIIQSALIVLLLGQMVGYLFGHLIRAAVREKMVSFELANPIPVDDDSSEAKPPSDQRSQSEVDTPEVGVELEGGS